MSRLEGWPHCKARTCVYLAVRHNRDLLMCLCSNICDRDRSATVSMVILTVCRFYSYCPLHNVKSVASAEACKHGSLPGIAYFTTEDGYKWEILDEHCRLHSFLPRLAGHTAPDNTPDGTSYFANNMSLSTEYFNGVRIIQTPGLANIELQEQPVAAVLSHTGLKPELQ